MVVVHATEELVSLTDLDSLTILPSDEEDEAPFSGFPLKGVFLRSDIMNI